MKPSLNPRAVDVNALQGRASDPSLSVWVGASAGSGKTKVLADRVTRLLLADVRPEKILCLTFTRAAAAEMSVRLMKRLSDWAVCAEEKLDADLAALEGDAFDPGLRLRARRLFARTLACPGGMRIQTIHGFAQEVLRRFPVEAGLAPHFSVIEEAESDALKQESIAEILEYAAEGADPGAAACLSRVVGLMAEQTLGKLMGDILSERFALQSAVKRSGDLSGLLARARERLGLNPGENEAFFRASACAHVSDNFRKVVRIAWEKGTKQPRDYAERILRWLGADEATRLRDWDDYASIFITQKGTPNTKLLTKKLCEDYPFLEESYREETARVQAFLEKREAAAALENTQAVLRLGMQTIESYEKRKNARAALDYDDLIQKANDLFARPGIAPWVLYKLDGGIDHILVDESQDTSPGQWRIVRALADEYAVGESARSDRRRTLFVVGDEKQSIFSFQGADPEEFFRMRAHFAKKYGEAGKPFEEVPLNVSFRSAPAILRAVDAVFADDASRAGVSHAPVSHEAYRGEGAGLVEVWPLVRGQEEEEGEEETTEASEEKEWSLPSAYETAHNPAAELAKTIAARIEAWIAQGAGIFDRSNGAFRPMHAGDVMILVRHRGALVGHLVRELKDRAIPVAGVDRMRLADQLAVMDLLALLQFSLLPQDDLTLATVLRGPLIGASEDELMAVAIGRKGSLWDSLKAREGAPYASWVEYLRDVAAQADKRTPLSMLAEILSAPCPADSRSGRRAIMERLGPEAEDPIDELLNAAADFGTARGTSLQAFAQEMSVSETEVKRELEQAQGRVRITTVHASKGLEAPIVILPDTVSVPERQRLPKLIWAGEKEIPFYVPRETPCAPLHAMRDALFEKEMAEYRRLLYVALTRAADRLVICGHTGKKTCPANCWYAQTEKALAPLHQEGTQSDAKIVLADYAIMPKAPRLKERKTPCPASSVALPAWVLTPPAPEPSPPRPLVPSRPSEPEPSVLSPQDSRFARGRLMHRMLQGLPDVVPARREAAARSFLANPQHRLPPAQQEEMAREALALFSLPAAAPFFSPQSRAEVPIVGLTADTLISGQIDRLALVGDEIWILDYKSNRPPPSAVAGVPLLYRKQMEAYRSVLKNLYPGKKIRCFLLWTYKAALMELPGA